MKTKATIFGIVIFLLLLVGGGSVYIMYFRLNRIPKIVDYYPKGELYANDGEILLRFDGQISTSKLKIILTPDHPLNMKVSGNKSEVIFSPRDPFGFSQTYSVDVVYSGKNILKFTFVTPQVSTDVKILEKNALSVKTNYPYAQFLPIKTKKFKLKYIAPLTLRVDSLTDVLPTEDEVNGVLNELADLNKVPYREQTLIYVNQNGGY